MRRGAHTSRKTVSALYLKRDGTLYLQLNTDTDYSVGDDVRLEFPSFKVSGKFAGYSKSGYMFIKNWALDPAKS